MRDFNMKYLSADLRSGLVVFLVALPLCLGIALASGAPLFSGIIAGIVGGIVVGTLSNSQLSVSGPAAGLTAIVLTAIASLGTFEAFLLAGVIAGMIQLLLGFAKAGVISNYLPSNVIEGMLAAIGIIIILTQLPHAIGYDSSHSGNFFSIEHDGLPSIFSGIIGIINGVHPGSIIVVLISLAALIAFEKITLLKRIKVIPGALVAVLAGVMINEIFRTTGSKLVVGEAQLVSLPVVGSFSEFMTQFRLPDFTQIANPEIWVTALTLAAVASIETLLCIEAADKLDPMKRFTNTNTELKAQGVGNMLSCLIGGIPMTSVIVRTSANINSGARTKISAISHGLFLLTAVVAIPAFLNRIPLASLAAVLIMIGFKLASPRIFIQMWQKGRKFQFIPFFVTVVAVVFTDLLTGVGIGMVISVYFILRGNVKLAYFFRRDEHIEGETIQIELAQEVSFLNKAAIKQTLMHLPENSRVIIDASHTVYIDHDVLHLIKDFVKASSKEKNIAVELVGFRREYNIDNSATHVTSVMSNPVPEVAFAVNDQQFVFPNQVRKGIKVPSTLLKLQGSVEV
jgi:MFS superfamily sulfate permease-like transporter